MLDSSLWIDNSKLKTQNSKLTYFCAETMNMAKIEVKKLATLGGHKDCVYTLQPGSEPHLFFSSGADGMILQWNLNDLSKAQLMARVENSVYAIDYYADRKALIIGENHEGIHVLDLDTKTEIGSMKLSNSPIFDIKTVKDRIFTAHGDGKVRILDLTTLQTIHEFQATGQSARCLAINEAKAEFAVGYSDNKIRVYSLINQELKHEINAHEVSIFTVQYSPDQRYLLSGSRDAHLKVWGVEKGYSLKKSVAAHTFTINHLVYSPDGKYFVTCSMDKSIKIWDAETFILLKVIDKARHAGHGTSVNKLLWSSHNNLLVSGSDDRSLSVWDINFNPSFT